mmetsp:Transcript_4594/g.11842  ORF Transcript_4594/g.11842 Transcript_4594/m.11842 type:complete len:333 (+) Transcript_4594:81-1079(+)|eukprot:CAMPEP_0197415642 /NCGR_PEP_ID=MMETSP1170-20131217/2130_1 /TAXON_ID=54406 /ORGANISM="Sarcinochrysis sp, Strain CCMP770" /LENGTH=332 /DNA_ID=CAMNT_0042942469 /DNA_START=81 /DNA_END=1079 /DNA_ORIENTATION=-
MSTGASGAKEEAEGWDGGLMGTFAKRFDRDSLARGWEEVVEKTKAKLNEAPGKLAELSNEASARSKELALGASQIGETLAQRVKEAVGPAEAARGGGGDDDDATGLLEEGGREGDDSGADEAPPAPAWWDVTSLTSSLSIDAVPSLDTVGKRLGDGGRDLVGFGKRLGDNSRDLASKFTSSMADSRECGLTRAQRFKWYVALLLLSTFFFGLAFQLIIAPPKFAMSFTLGTIASLAAKAMLNGPYTQLRLMFHLRKLPYTLALLGTTALTLYLCLTHANFILVAAASFAQIAALLYYLFGDTPGGKAGIKLLFKLILNTAKLIAKPFIYAFQ